MNCCDILPFAFACLLAPPHPSNFEYRLFVTAPYLQVEIEELNAVESLSSEDVAAIAEEKTKPRKTSQAKSGTKAKSRAKSKAKSKTKAKSAKVTKIQPRDSTTDRNKVELIAFFFFLIVVVGG